jgi:hypothetical protein
MTVVLKLSNRNDYSVLSRYIEKWQMGQEGSFRRKPPFEGTSPSEEISPSEGTSFGRKFFLKESSFQMFLLKEVPFEGRSPLEVTSLPSKGLFSFGRTSPSEGHLLLEGISHSKGTSFGRRFFPRERSLPKEISLPKEMSLPKKGILRKEVPSKGKVPSE